MKAFKIIDIIVQLLIFIFALGKNNGSWDIDYNDAFTVFYFGLGGWQVFSMYIHICSEKYKNFSRKWYEKCVITLLLITLFTLPFFFIMGFILLWIGPPMAIWYFLTCCAELTFARPKPVEQTNESES